MADPKNDIALHETDYFIWSNTASDAHTTKLDKANAAHTSSNYFMAQTAEHLNAKVSPYLALLTELHDEIPAMARLGRNDGEWKNDSSLTMLDAQGARSTRTTCRARPRNCLQTTAACNTTCAWAKTTWKPWASWNCRNRSAYAAPHAVGTAHDNCDSIIERLNEHEERCTARWATYTRATDPLRKTQARQDPRGIS